MEAVASMLSGLIYFCALCCYLFLALPLFSGLYGPPTTPKHAGKITLAYLGSFAIFVFCGFFRLFDLLSGKAFAWDYWISVTSVSLSPSWFFGTLWTLATWLSALASCVLVAFFAYVFRNRK